MLVQMARGAPCVSDAFSSSLFGVLQTIKLDENKEPTAH
jgi:hypothetical protein